MWFYAVERVTGSYMWMQVIVYRLFSREFVYFKVEQKEGK